MAWAQRLLLPQRWSGPLWVEETWPGEPQGEQAPEPGPQHTPGTPLRPSHTRSHLRLGTAQKTGVGNMMSETGQLVKKAIGSRLGSLVPSQGSCMPRSLCSCPPQIAKATLHA